MVIVQLYSYFNTSNVTIQLELYAEKRAGKRISIHLMLLFNSIAWITRDNVTKISIHLMLLFNRAGNPKQALVNNFNTSNVTIQRPIRAYLNIKKSYFNTSNVTIQQGKDAGVR